MRGLPPAPSRPLCTISGAGERRWRNRPAYLAAGLAIGPFGVGLFREVQAEFPLTRVFLRAFDRGHAIRLVQAGVEFQIRETFESALVFSREVPLDLGFSHDQVDETVAEVRRRDGERFTLQLAEGDIAAGRHLMCGNVATSGAVGRAARDGRSTGRTHAKRPAPDDAGPLPQGGADYIEPWICWARSR